MMMHFKSAPSGITCKIPVPRRTKFFARITSYYYTRSDKIMCSWLDFVFRNQVIMQNFYAKTLTHCALCTGFGWHDSILVAVAADLQVSRRAVGRFLKSEGLTVI